MIALRYKSANPIIPPRDCLLVTGIIPLKAGWLVGIESEKRAVATQLAQGVNFQRILDNIRDNLGRNFKRIHLLNRQILRTYGLQGAQRHKDDATSVCLWVEEMKKSKDNPVIIYKPQVMKQPENCDNLSEKDFVIGIQTPLQESIMKSLSNDRVNNYWMKL